MINELISTTVRGLQKPSLFATLLVFLFTDLTANSQIYEFGTSSVNRESVSVIKRKLIINQTTGTVKVTFGMHSYQFGNNEDVVLDTRIGMIFENDKSEIVIVDSNKEAVAAVFVNNSGTQGYFVYRSNSDKNTYKVDLSKPENNLATFKKLKQAVKSGAFNKSTPKNSAGSSSGIIKPATTGKSSTTNQTKPSSTPSTSIQKSATVTPPVNDIPYSSTVSNARYYLKKPGQKLPYVWLITFDVTDSRQMDRYNYLYVQNADTQQFLKNARTGNDYFGMSFNGFSNLTLDLEADELPAATPQHPMRLRMWIYMSTGKVKGWIGKFSSPVYIWDGTYMRQQ